MISINGNLFENYQNTKKFDKFFSLETDKTDFSLIKMYKDVLVKRSNDSKSISFIKDYGNGIELNKIIFDENLYSFEVSEENSYIILVFQNKIVLKRIIYDNDNSLLIENNNYTDTFFSYKNNNILNYDVLIEKFKPNKYFDSYLFHFYNCIVCFSVNKNSFEIFNLNQSYKDYFIAGNCPLEVTDNKYSYLYVMENNRGSINLYKNEKETKIDPNIKSEIFQNNYDLDMVTVNTISNIYQYIDSENKMKILISLFSGDFYSFDFSNNTLKNKKFLFNVKGTIEKVVVTSKYLLISHDLNEIIVWNIENSSRDIIQLSNTPTDLISNNLFMTVVEDENIIGYYKLENVPNIHFNYWWVENYNVDDLDSYVLNNHITLKHRYNIIDKNPYNIKLDYREICSTNETFPETMQKRNLYMFLDKKNILVEPSFKLYNDKLYYTITNEKLNYSISNYNTEVSEDELLPKIFIKDVYYLNGSIYFRMKFLFKDNYIMVVKIGDKRIVINKITERFYVKTIDDTKYFFTYKDTESNSTRFLVDRKDVKVSNNFISTLEFQRLYDEVDYMHNQWYWFQIDDLDYLSDYKFDFELYYKKKEENHYNLVDEYSNSYPSRFTFMNEILYKTHDGDIKMIENLFLQEEGEKDSYLQKMADPIFETLLSNNEIYCNKDTHIGNFINSERNIGQLDLTTNYPFAFKDSSLVSNIFINGKKVFRSYYKQFDDLKGSLYSFIPIRLLKEYMNSSDYLETKKTGKVSNKYEILVNGCRRKLVESEKVLVKHTIDNTLENETNILGTTGLYIPAKIDKTTRSDYLRVYVKLKSWNYFRRLNPDRYNLTIDYNYNFIKLIINGANYCTEGAEIFIVSNGVMNGLNFYKDLDNTPYDIDCIPLIEMDEESNVYTNTITKPEDLEIIVDGYTLYPKIDYDIVNLVDESIPTLIVFNYIIPKTCKIEINNLNENQNYVRYFKYTAENTDNIISFDDDSLLLIPNSFVVYIDNLKVKSKDIEIINSKSFKINGYKKDDIKNIMVRFSYDDHTHLKEIFDIYKYDNIDFNDKNYHSYYKIKPTTKYSSEPSSTIRKLIILNNLQSDRLNVFNCNDTESTTVFDIILDSTPFESIYQQDDIIIDCNPINE